MPKIATREIPPTIPFPEPVPHVVPHMSTITPNKPDCRRVRENEIPEIMTWLPEKLLQRWPRLSHDGVWSWLRATLNDRNSLFIRTDNIVGLFFISRDVLEPMPQITERFVRGRTKDTDEYIKFYSFVKDYAIQIKARFTYVNVDTDRFQDIYAKVASELRDYGTRVSAKAKTLVISFEDAEDET